MTKPHPGAPRQPENGTIMVLVMTVLAALLAGGAVALYIQVSATRATSSANQARTSLYCAEAGLHAARLLVVENYLSWEPILAGECPAGTECPTWYQPPPDHQDLGAGYYGRLDDVDIDADNPPHYRVTIYDNDDEFDTTPDPESDNDLAVFVRSDCLRYPAQPRTIVELIDFRSIVGCVQNEQGGGCPANAGNSGDVGVPQ